MSDPRDAAPPTDLPAVLPETVRRVVEGARQKKAVDLVVLDLRDAGAFTDFFVVCSGRSDRQVRAIADEIKKQLKTIGAAPTHIEGYEHAHWILIDCFDFIVHVFTAEQRRFYDLERLWGSATRYQIADDPRSGVAASAS